MKSFLKVSLLVCSLLTACSSGSSVIPDSSLPDYIEPDKFPPVSDEVNVNNKSYTTLPSRIAVGDNYVDVGDVNFTILKDGKVANFSFTTDENSKIVGIETVNFEEIGVKEYLDKFEFNAFKYTEERDDASEGVYEEALHMAPENFIDLAYSDFGFIWQIANGADPENSQYKKYLSLDEIAHNLRENKDYASKNYLLTYFGGYDDRKILPENINEELEFSGRAVASITAGVVDPSIYYEDKYKEYESPYGTKFLDVIGDATLTFDSSDGIAKTTVDLKFSDWHDINIQQIGNDSPVISFIRKDLSGKYSSEDRDLLSVYDLSFYKTKMENFAVDYYVNENTNEVVEATGGFNVFYTNKVKPENGSDDFYKENLESWDRYISVNGAFGTKKK